MDVTEILPLGFELELAEGLDEGHALDVTHGAPELGTHTQRGLKLLPKQHLVKVHTKDNLLQVLFYLHNSPTNQKKATRKSASSMGSTCPET